MRQGRQGGSSNRKKFETVRAQSEEIRVLPEGRVTKKEAMDRRKKETELELGNWWPSLVKRVETLRKKGKS